MHDPAYKLLFSEPRMVADLLRGFVPGHWDRWLDLSTLTKASPEYVGDTLARRLGDMLWRVHFGENAPAPVSGGAGELLVMLEFQSSTDTAMGARLLSSIGMVHQERVRRGALRGTGRLPPVLPLVFYNGESRWGAAVQVRETIAPVGGVLDGVQPRLRYRVIDAGAVGAQDPGSENRVSALVRLENSATVVELWRGLREVFERFGGPEAVGFRAGLYEWARHSPLVRRSGAELPPRRELEGGEMATLLEARAREWERQWYREGRAEGIGQGVEQGRAEERTRLYHRLVARKFGSEMARRLSERLGRIPEDGLAAEVGDWIIECETGTELLDRVERASGQGRPERPEGP